MLIALCLLRPKRTLDQSRAGWVVAAAARLNGDADGVVAADGLVWADNKVLVARAGLERPGALPVVLLAQPHLVDVAVAGLGQALGHNAGDVAARGAPDGAVRGPLGDPRHAQVRLVHQHH